MSRNGRIFEFGKCLRRLIDGHYSNRKVVIFLFFFCGCLLYFGPSLAQWLFSNNRGTIEAFEDQCIKEKLEIFHADVASYDATIIEHNDESEDEVINKYLPFVGNGVFGVQIIPRNGHLYIKQGRTLSLDIQWDPLVLTTPDNDVRRRESTVMHFTDGIVYKYQCIKDGYYVANQYYAHRILDGIFVQNISIVNPSSLPQKVWLEFSANKYWTETMPTSLDIDGITHKYTIASGYVQLPDSDQVITVAIIYSAPQQHIIVKPKSTTKLQFLTSIYYGNSPVTLSQHAKDQQNIEEKAIEALRKAINLQQKQGIREQHVNLWRNYWHTGFSISQSKAKDALNGDKINSTIYYVLSQIAQGVSDVEKSTANNEGCYRGHHTLDAPRLWKDTSTIDGVNAIVKAWLITLEKQGCHRLLTGGPIAVQQAIILSLGGLRFSNQDLEFNIDPQYLHRNYLFRRISYGNVTHVNISVTVGNDNRAILSVALDQSDSNYYGCDAGCLDVPVSLSQSYTNFPVKLTKPLTAILYITSDYQHMQDLRNALHVHEVEEAPAHDHHVMALHKHGHQLGGLPTFFWISICFLIVIFHMFLCKLIIAEYCGHQEHQRTRFTKP